MLAAAPYGPGVADTIYSALRADPAAAALHDAVYPRKPVPLPDGRVYEPPERFGAIG